MGSMLPYIIYIAYMDPMGKCVLNVFEEEQAQNFVPFLSDVDEYS